MPADSRQIAVYADWTPGVPAERLGWLHCHSGGAGEAFEFQLEQAFINHPDYAPLQLDPDVHWLAGPQFPVTPRTVFGFCQDAAPDRWGRMLMNRRNERDQRIGKVAKDKRLIESDYLLGVHDGFRVGALRFRPNDHGPFMDDREGRAAPPFARLRELEAASRAMERDDDSPAVDDWLRLLLAPGGSLGGARPKASVVDQAGNLWIAKFPSAKDQQDVGAWELLVHTLAKACEIQVPEARANRYASAAHTFLVRRFDRPAPSVRQHFASAMTLTGKLDGQSADAGISYLDIAQVLMDYGAQTAADLEQLWRRIVFNLCISNADDHLRNHGFLLLPGQGWRLSPAYDMNPVPDATGLTLNITSYDNALDLDLAREVAEIFRLSQTSAEAIIVRTQKLVRQWPTLAGKLGISAREQKRMQPAFRLAGFP